MNLSAVYVTTSLDISPLLVRGSIFLPGVPIASPSVPYLYAGNTDKASSSALSSSVKFGL